VPISPDLPDVLAKIVEQRRERLHDITGIRSAPPPGPLPPLRDNAFLSALSARRGRAVIAEIKMGSPRLGSLIGRVDPLAQAQIYAEGGAAAMSVVVEPDFFHGSYELLEMCKTMAGLPVIAKDFVVDGLQLTWARDFGADAVLLVAALYDKATLHGYANQARQLGLLPLIEVHDLADVAKLDGARWELVGVNNRNLRTFEVQIETSLALLPSLPTSALHVAESGIESRRDLAMLRGAGFDAFLIGESLLLADDPAAKLAELLSA
jgi:indole-3-glycerol phosphate synthase